jgi:hypothetical protein
LLVVALLLGLAACSSDDDNGGGDEAVQTGTVRFMANGEDFIREPFVSKDGWTIAFDHFFVNFFGPTALQGTVEGEEADAGGSSAKAVRGGVEPMHAGHPHTGITAGEVHVALVGDYLVDLHQTPLAGQGEDRTLVGTVEDGDALGNVAKTGDYNSVNFNVKPVERLLGAYTGTCPAMSASECAEAAEAMEGYGLRMVGTASDGVETVGFDIRLLPVLDGDPDASGLAWSSCTWEGDPERPGLVTAGGSGWVEMTFHSDHIFGNGEEPDPDLDDFATGFEPFNKVAEAGGCNAGEDRCIVATQEDLREQWGNLAGNYPELQYAYGMLVYALGTLGHCGEGHCLH